MVNSKLRQQAKVVPRRIPCLWWRRYRPRFRL